MRTRMLAAAGAVAITLGAGAAALQSPVNAVPLPSATGFVFDDPELECLQLAGPHAAHVPVVDSDAPVSLDLHVLADRGVSEARAAEVVAQAQRTYTPLNINLNIVGSQHVSFTGVDPLDLIAQAKSVFGGSRPAGSDLVVMVTSADLALAPSGNGVAGLADCIGGVRYADRAFMVVEDIAQTFDYPDEGFDVFGVALSTQLTAKAFAHEVGHLLGAHHHYGNCTEGAVAALDQDYAPCTVMLTVIVDFLSHRFGTVNGAVVRGHAEEWAQ